jgi:hypothetical protein
MTLITYRGRPVAMAGRDRFYLAPEIDRRPNGDPVKTFVCSLVLYVHDVRTGQLRDEPRRYVPARAERYARECLIPAAAFLERAARPDAELAQHFAVPLEQIHHRRAELAAHRRQPPRSRRPSCLPAGGGSVRSSV